MLPSPERLVCCAVSRSSSLLLLLDVPAPQRWGLAKTSLEVTIQALSDWGPALFPSLVFRLSHSIQARNQRTSGKATLTVSGCRDVGQGEIEAGGAFIPRGLPSHCLRDIVCQGLLRLQTGRDRPLGALTICAGSLDGDRGRLSKSGNREVLQLDRQALREFKDALVPIELAIDDPTEARVRDRLEARPAR